jgi:hypothetical protein
VLPLAWQLLFIEQTVVSMGCTSAANFGEMPAQEKVLPPPPEPPPVSVLLFLLQDAVNIIQPITKRAVTVNFFMPVVFILNDVTQ